MPADARVALLWARYEERHLDSWDERFRAWDDLHQVVVPSFPLYTPLRGYIEARNALVHGVGSLTRRQLKRERKTRGFLASAGINVEGTRISVTRDDGIKCATTLHALVAWLDEAASRIA